MAELKRKQYNKELSKNVFENQLVTRENSGLSYIELRLLTIESGGVYEESLTDLEVCAVVLTGKATITEGQHCFNNIGTRDDVFEKIPTDSVYVSAGKTYQVTTETEARILLCYAPSTLDLPTQLIAAADNTVEKRGIYQNKRMVHNIMDDQSTVSDKLIVVEVFTDSGNWSSYPPHKHDQDNLPVESFLEETYYHEMNPRQGFVFQRVYTDDRSLDETMAVENGDVVIVPKGYHPVSVPDGYDGYYLNIMAGPTKKWKFHNDPDHEWILSRT
ncbi:5-deoxy-glucuronate isomerase [Vagococcus penaei]|uniref:5-deoxy-glucuronate isomerase n=1 Tax=Vagococcus penaei TaxID=633807 RepID=A0A1Q2D784_9ENTE|nr:5-deoxy-glucuronate isomerase [Vagococcus penaei]AQP54259.1 5-deoxy-glucuronate isomerase [Vagococcus penaei]RSU05854.1 5-deoxy-glucuronate isomerase [Vagococcus penaei]